MYNNSLNLGNSFKFSKYQYCICKTVTIFVWLDCLGKTKANKKIKAKQMCERHLEHSAVIGFPPPTLQETSNFIYLTKFISFLLLMF